jgi:NAD(P)-dependent dehydrogenase (short-subunit alcohol dehydrogenase family)
VRASTSCGSYHCDKLLFLHATKLGRLATYTLLLSCDLEEYSRIYKASPTYLLRFIMKDKVIVITGAASGIGLETARVLASKGAKLSLADVQENLLKELETELKQAGAEVITRVVDIRDRQAVESWIAATVDRFGKLDGAANLAGTIGKQANAVEIENVDDDDFDFVMAVNVVGLRNCLRAQIPHFNEGASVVNAASILGVIGAPKNLAYSASKHAVVGMTRVAAKELGPRKIRVNCICP